MREQIVSEICRLEKEGIDKIIISNKNADTTKYRKVEIKKIVLQGNEKFQCSCYTEKQVFQNNFSKEELQQQILLYFPEHFFQMNIFTKEFEYGYKVTKKGKMLTNKNKRQSIAKKVGVFDVPYEHNRKKNYLLKEGEVIPPLVDMGIFTKEGKVVQSMYDKYKQINRFIEIVDDVLKDETKEEINIIDFGCGKSYLTFILYYYLVEMKKKKVNIVGLDLKADVIQKCNETAKKYKYDNLKFELGDINGYKATRKVDMVVTLHACDTATDYALFNAVSWKAKYILSVPCCQHEVNQSIKSETLAPMMKYGIIKERMSALVTDALRATMLEYCGYKTQVLEFVDLTHSPKNILIRAVKNNVSKEKKEKALKEAYNMCEDLGIEPTIYKLLS